MRKTLHFSVGRGPGGGQGARGSVGGRAEKPGSLLQFWTCLPDFFSYERG